ncbi:inner membrane-spanning protein YciB [Sedimentitalea nanhaiensis]|uniref:Inner membrane-spanning protein YciB n=1 Tax=Sedimentitalea nanhaiensis TaxID=999627 RepID=A0A1I7E0S3_9RHOB|nr:inner membrane-spanning protein YciB [Sedimentitalea nanhaiensis]SFU17528.1 intracellular septation protein [Sedimentitalea nanhaiensis]
MAEPKEINMVLKQVLELGPTVAFFLLYLKIQDKTYSFGGTDYSGFIVAAVVFVPILLVSMAILWRLTGHLSRMQIFTAFMVIFFGGLTAWFNDERFFKMKTSIVYGCFSALLGIGLAQGKSYLAWVMGDLIPMENQGWMILTRRLFVFFIVLAIGNELVWRNMSEAAWVKIETFAFPAVLFGFLWWQIVALQKFMIDPEDKADPDVRA